MDRFGYECIGGSGLADVHFRVRDRSDNRIATCYLEENARLIVDGLNERDRLAALNAELRTALAEIYSDVKQHAIPNRNDPWWGKAEVALAKADKKEAE